MRCRRGLVGTVAAALVLVGVAGCTRDPARPAARPIVPPPHHGVAVAPTAIIGPGSTIAGGVEVQVGSSLVVGAFPLVDSSTTPPTLRAGSWQAVVLVDGDPLEVWARYIDALGIGP